ncbi:hypothetical protein [Desulfoscipio gibsoniae]|uniref:DUF2878 domain-containing protein n=1 Tax=Desulfoscipio gibsoniae DSM 7213 TaxID=767817 RepID=R4KUW8_9FIRM|nr:hypothetical protein [Desulfoscipio gibsoniae]AGL03416.1 hypothetical protein Desgi_4161 [Desulfoscipio gibsoniae DSM 7213]
MFGKSIFFFYKALLFGIAAYAIIPRPEFKKYLIYGFIFGAIGDIIVLLITGPVLNLYKYFHLGPFGIWGIFTFWTPISWMFAFMLFFYFLPVRIPFLLPYVAGFSMFGYMVGLVLQGLGMYEYIGNYIYFAPVTFLIWFSIAAFSYIRIGNIRLNSHLNGE